MPSSLSRTQKAGFVLLLVFGLVTVGMGFLQMRNTIYGPFVLRTDKNKADAPAFEDETLKQQRSDTDQDGLNDYEEIQFYSTSAYLPDTDSDGVADKTEIDNGADPLCPEGQSCNSAADSAPVGAPSAVTEPNVAGFDLLDAVAASVAESGGSATSSVAVSPQTPVASDMSAVVNNPAALRDLLRKTGKFTEEQLGKIDDATLRRVAGEVVRENQ